MMIAESSCMMSTNQSKMTEAAGSSMSSVASNVVAADKNVAPVSAVVTFVSIFKLQLPLTLKLVVDTKRGGILDGE